MQPFTDAERPFSPTMSSQKEAARHLTTAEAGFWVFSRKGSKHAFQKDLTCSCAQLNERLKTACS